MIELSIIIVNFNTKELLQDCLQSVFKTAKGINFEVIVVDNGSSDGSNEIIREKFSQVRFIKNETNLGFAKANNMGIRQAQGNYILLLNSDTIVSENTLKYLLDFAKINTDVGIVAPKLLNRDGSIQVSVRKPPTLLGAIQEYIFKQPGSFDSYEPRGKSFSEVECVIGAAILVPKEVFSKVGLLDERYFMYFEDLEFCRRLRRKGFKIYYLPNTTVIHLLGATGKKTGQPTNELLKKSSRIYHGFLIDPLIQLVLKVGQKL